jgi:general secretion pathway protein I
MPGTNRRQSGFSLLEAIVALVLLSTTGLALMDWLNQSLSTANRQNERIEEAALLRLAASRLQAINPVIEVQGEWRSAGVTVRWRTASIAPSVPNALFAGDGGGGPWRLSLWRVDAEVEQRGRVQVLSIQRLVTERAGAEKTL